MTGITAVYDQLEDSFNLSRMKTGTPAADCMMRTGEIIRKSSGEYSKDALFKKLPIQVKLPRQTMSTIFMQIMNYLLESKRIAADRTGHICWTYCPDVVTHYMSQDNLRFSDEKNKGCIYFGDENVLAGYADLQASSNLLDQYVLKSLKDVAEVLEDNNFSGELIPKRLIPKKYNKNYESCNLWRYNLGNSWKLIYRVLSDENKRVVILADWMSNKDYERLFGFNSSKY